MGKHNEFSEEECDYMTELCQESRSRILEKFLAKYPDHDEVKVRNKIKTTRASLPPEKVGICVGCGKSFRSSRGDLRCMWCKYLEGPKCQ